jgi:serine/threonine-protein kinase
MCNWSLDDLAALRNLPAVAQARRLTRGKRSYTELALAVAGSDRRRRPFRERRPRSLGRSRSTAASPKPTGHIKFACDYDWAGAEAEFKRAIELNPNSGEVYDFYGLMLSSLERYDEAIEMQRPAHALDPLAHRIDLVTTFLRAGRYDEALRALTRVLEVEPDLALAHATLGWIHLMTGKAEQGIGGLERAVAPP